MSGPTKDLILSQLKNSDEMCFVASEQSGQNDISSFISELIIYDLIEAGSEAKLKELGKFHVKGRDYIVEDGDILSFRFNV